MNRQVMAPSLDQLETRLEHVAHNFPYPPTPDLAAGVRQRLTKTQPISQPRRLAWSLLLAAAVVIGLFMLTPVRTMVWEVLQQGVVRIFLMEPLATGTPLATITPAASAESPATGIPSSVLVTPRPVATPISELRHLTGETISVEPPVPIILPARPPVKGVCPKF
ncbi:MAG: hypothetical protein JXM69_12735 [Anaerolineae bacterium]|nr:hypothetical protein [Anaerolineae bacterium]